MGDKETKYILWYDEMEGADFPVVGKKNSNLGEMIKAGIPVSHGFAVTIYANDQFLVLSGIKEKIEKQITSLGQYIETARKQRHFDGLKRMPHAGSIERAILDSRETVRPDLYDACLWRSEAAAPFRCWPDGNISEHFARRPH